MHETFLALSDHWPSTLHCLKEGSFSWYSCERVNKQLVSIFIWDLPQPDGEAFKSLLTVRAGHMIAETNDIRGQNDKYPRRQQNIKNRTDQTKYFNTNCYNVELQYYIISWQDMRQCEPLSTKLSLIHVLLILYDVSYPLVIQEKEHLVWSFVSLGSDCLIAGHVFKAWFSPLSSSLIKQ